MAVSGRERGFLSWLPTPIFTRLTDEATHMRYDDGQLIHERGEKKPGFSMVRKGRVRLGRVGQNGNFIEFGILRAGDVFGEMSVIRGMERTHDALAIGTTVVDQLPGERFQRILEDHPELQNLMLRLMAGRLFYAYQRIDDILSLPLIDRVAQHILDTGKRSADPHAVVLKQVDLAEAMAASRVSISKVLSQLSALGFVKTGYGRIEITDKSAMANWLKKRGGAVGRSF